jgi:hypothetical protein
VTSGGGGLEVVVQLLHRVEISYTLLPEILGFLPLLHLELDFALFRLNVDDLRQ